MFGVKAIIIDKHNSFDDIGFQKYVLFACKHILLSNLNKKKLQVWDEYLNSSNILNTESGDKKISSLSVFQEISNNFILQKFEDNLYELKIDENTKAKDIDIKLSNVCRLINFGNVEMRGYPIITDTLNYISDNINMLYMLYNGVV